MDSSHSLGSTMFLPTDLTSGEEDLAATVKRQLLAHRQPTSPEDETAVRQEAAQVAAEMIQAHRAEISSEEESNEDLPETGYHSRLRARLERERAILEEESAEIGADRLS